MRLRAFWATSEANFMDRDDECVVLLRSPAWLCDPGVDVVLLTGRWEGTYCTTMSNRPITT